MDIKINSNFPFSVASIQFTQGGGLCISLASDSADSGREYQYAASLGDGSAEEKTPVSLVQYARDYADNSDIKQKTKLSYHTMITHIREYGDTDLDKITTAYLLGFIEYLQNRGLKPGTVRLDFQKLACVLHDAHKNELFDDRILQRVKRPKKEQEKKCYLTEAEIRRLERNPLPERHRNVQDMFLFSCMTGLRFGDVQGLQWKDVRRSGRRLWIEFLQRKTGTLERLPLGCAAEAILNRLPKIGTHVFGRVCNQWTNALLKKWCRKARIKKPVTFHIARHTFCVMLLTKDVPIYTVQKLMCHTDIGTTNVYADLTGKSKAKAVGKLPSFAA